LGVVATHSAAVRLPQEAIAEAMTKINNVRFILIVIFTNGYVKKKKKKMAISQIA
jgi:hypothetical protein